MIVRRIAVAVTCAGCMAVSSIAHAQSRSPQTPRANVTWTIGGAGAGFGIGLWAGLKAFDDSINSERKVWTTAVVSAAVGAVGGYLIGKARARHAGVSAVRSDAGLPVVASRLLLATPSSPSQGQVDSGAENPRLPNHSARPDSGLQGSALRPPPRRRPEHWTCRKLFGAPSTRSRRSPKFQSHTSRGLASSPAVQTLPAARNQEETTLHKQVTAFYLPAKSAELLGLSLPMDPSQNHRDLWDENTLAEGNDDEG